MPKIMAPTLVVAGSADDQDLVEAAQRLPRGELRVIEAGHWIHETKPEVFIQTLRTFLKKYSAGK